VRLSVESRIGGVNAAWRRSKIIAPWIHVGGYSWWHDGTTWKREDSPLPSMVGMSHMIDNSNRRK